MYFTLYEIFLFSFLSICYLLNYVQSQTHPVNGVISSVGKIQAFRQCYLAKNKRISQSQADLSTSSRMSRSEVLQSLTLGGNINIKLGSVEASAGFQFQNSFTENSLSISYFYLMKVTREVTYDWGFGDKILDKDYIDLKNTDPLNFILYCGDHVPRKVIQGGSLIVEVKTTFDSDQYKQMFQGNASLGAGSFLNISSNIKDEFRRLNINGAITLKAKQFGGDPKQLANILGDIDNTVSCGSSVDASNTQKDKKDEEKCANATMNIVNYLKNSFPNQFKEDNDFFDFTQETMNSGAVINPKSDILNKIRQNYIRITSFLNFNQYYINNLKNFKEIYPLIKKMDLIFLDNLDRLYQKLVKNNDKIFTGTFSYKFTDCWQDLTNCANIEEFESNFKQFEWNVYTEVDSLMNQVKEVRDIDLYIDHCNVAAFGAKQSVRMYPLGAGKWEATEMRTPFSNLRTIKVLNGWLWTGAVTRNYNDFQFLVYQPLSYNAKVTPSAGALSVSCSCGGAKASRDSTVVIIRNPHYFVSKTIEDFY